MRLLLDECLPRKLKMDLVGHDVSTVRDMGWTSKKNGELLRLMIDEGFQCLLTLDQNLEYQQPISDLQVAVVVIVARTNLIADIRRAIPEIVQVLPRVSPGQVIRISAS